MKKFDLKKHVIETHSKGILEIAEKLDGAWERYAIKRHVQEIRNVIGTLSDEEQDKRLTMLLDEGTQAMMAQGGTPIMITITDKEQKGE